MSDSLPLVIANHKANKTYSDFLSWIENVVGAPSAFGGTLIICPPMAFLGSAFEAIKKNAWKCKLGVQNISQFEQGAYTGEIAASQIKDICSYCLIGHSERRKYFNEDDELLRLKVEMLKGAGIEPIFCVQDQETLIPEGVSIVAYEPVFAIGTGKADSPHNARDVAKKIKSGGSFTVIYGGSVGSENVASFIEPGLIDGVLVGSASLRAEEFLSIIKNV